MKLIDVYPDGTAYNLDETIQRLRYRKGTISRRCGWNAGKVYKVTLQPMNTSNYFAAGHRFRIEVSSSNFPRFDRNLNTGGNNYDEAKGVVAHNAVHHSAEYPSQIRVSVVKGNPQSRRSSKHPSRQAPAPDHPLRQNSSKMRPERPAASDTLHCNKKHISRNGLPIGSIYPLTAELNRYNLG